MACGSNSEITMQSNLNTTPAFTSLVSAVEAADDASAPVPALRSLTPQEMAEVAGGVSPDDTNALPVQRW